MNYQYILPESGAHDRNRTGDLILTKDVLCRLSYMGVIRKSCNALAVKGASFIQVAFAALALYFIK